LMTGKMTAVDSPPPGVGLKTVTFIIPAVAISSALMSAVSSVLLI